MTALTAAAARAVRLRSLLLTGDPADASGDAVLGIAERLGALQGQDVRSLLWSLGVRLPGATVSGVQAALEERTVVRTWPMRGTLHLVPARDARWMVELMAGRVDTAAASRQRELGVSPADLDRAADVLGAALTGGGRLTRAECVAALAEAGVPVAGQAGYHVLGALARRAQLCLAPDVGTEQTFVLLEEWAPAGATPDRDEALATIATRYVRGHGPTSRRDLAGWTGLPLRDVDRGVTLAGASVSTVDVDGTELLVAPEMLDTADAPGHLVLPGFDEYMLGYKDRSLCLAADRLMTIVPGGNGVFRATLVRAGQVCGTWTRTLTKGRLVIDAVPFEPLPARDRAAFDAAFDRYGAFMEATTTQVRWGSAG
jgi:Winged helix DNA-binding domain